MVKLVLPVENLVLDLLDDELVDEGGREDYVGLGNSGTQRELGDGSVLRIDTLEVNHHHLIIIDYSPVPRTGLGDVIVQDTERGGHQLLLFSENRIRINNILVFLKEQTSSSQAKHLFILEIMLGLEMFGQALSTGCLMWTLITGEGDAIVLDTNMILQDSF